MPASPQKEGDGSCADVLSISEGSALSISPDIARPGERRDYGTPRDSESRPGTHPGAPCVPLESNGTALQEVGN